MALLQNILTQAFITVIAVCGVYVLTECSVLGRLHSWRLDLMHQDFL